MEEKDGREGRTEIEDTDIGKTLTSITPSKDQTLVPDNTGTMVTPPEGYVPSYSQLSPFDPIQVGDIESVDVVQSLGTVPSSEDEDLGFVQYCSLSSSSTRWRT